MVIGIVGSESAKFTADTEARARLVIRDILTSRLDVTGYSSGHCHLGGIDIWTEEIGNSLKLAAFVFPPRILARDGYKERNIKIATVSDEVHCITVKTLPANYDGMKFDYCYHCKTKDHVKSGGCWTANFAEKLKKKAYWHIID